MDNDLERKVRQRFLSKLDADDWGDEDPRLELGAAGLPLFVEATKKEVDPQRLSRLIRVIWQFRDRTALPVLADALQSPHDEVWKDALDGLVTLGGSQALQILHDTQAAMLGACEPDIAIKRSWIEEAIGQVQADLAFDDSAPPWKPMRLPKGPPKTIDEGTRDEWRDLGFYCALDKATKVWRLTGSRDGLLRFRDLLRVYADEDPGHYHLGPYFSPTLTTGPDAKIDERGIWGTLGDFRRLAELVSHVLDRVQPGSNVVISQEFGTGGYGILLDVRTEDFDPSTADQSLFR